MSSNFPTLTGLVTATHTPFTAEGALHLDGIERQAEHLLRNGIEQVFIGGSTGEAPSLTTSERRALAARWFEVAKGTRLRIIVHVGSNCLDEARDLAAHAQQLGAAAIAAVSPSYFKPRDLDALITSLAHIASAASQTPFYYYDIPVLTGLSNSMVEFLQHAPARIPTLAGLKFTNLDLIAFQSILQVDGGKWNVLYGYDELNLAALVLGAKGAVGSGTNFAPQIYQRLFRAFQAGDLGAAREEQLRGTRLVQTLVPYGYLGATKAVMEMIGVPVGPTRLPHVPLTVEQAKKLRSQLEGIGFFDWIRP